MEGTPRILFNNKITKSRLRSTMPQPLGASQNIYTVAMAHSYMILLRFESRQTLVASEKKREKNKYFIRPKTNKTAIYYGPLFDNIVPLPQQGFSHRQLSHCAPYWKDAGTFSMNYRIVSHRM